MSHDELKRREEEWKKQRKASKVQAGQSLTRCSPALFALRFPSQLGSVSVSGSFPVSSLWSGACRLLVKSARSNLYRHRSFRADC